MSESSGRTAAEGRQETFAIAVMGPTGTGKSTFINLLTNSDFGVGNDLESCTDSVHFTSPFDLEGKQVILIDTPGFDDTKITDSDVLKMIAASLSLIRGSHLKLAGVIYMHRIIDNRMGGISGRNFRMFRHLCGDSSLSNVVIVTSMWDQIATELGEAREVELKTKPIFFEPVIARGARIARHNNTTESARSIIRSILSRHSEQSTLQIQEELEAGISINATKAGQELDKDLRERSVRHQDELRVVMEEMREAIRLRDEESRKDLALEREKLEVMIKRLEHESASLASGYAEALTRLGAKFQSSVKPLAPRSSFSSFAQPVVAAAETESNAILEGKIAAAFPILGFWGRLAVMLAPFSLSWK
ncbi:hypothetical protein P691DRAFT_804502 [Macrolepiota fuliginosa MF-IS2]|uniref:G domain-containing protein n=1 Tax=Macrolepiota fuliginosa MF-IS2 TaxID=1400762 RepID=A0A9P6BZE9_9AGAR|nr:hypothetical protein P691DRAFT_804502 [Macrolepiota fuliginosa MF-IS2]